jgi:hypothetical protein
LNDVNGFEALNMLRDVFARGDLPIDGSETRE